MLELWYNANMDAETPLYYIYQDKQRIGWIKNVDKEDYIDAILIYKDYRNKGRIHITILKEPSEIRFRI